MNNWEDRIHLLKGLFTRREGYPCAGLTLASGLKLALVYKQISQVGLPYHVGQVNQLYWRHVFYLFLNKYGLVTHHTK